MPSFTLLLSLSVPWIAGVPDPVAAASAADVDADSTDALAEILASDALIEEEEPAPDVARWALHDVLLDDFAQSVALERAVAGAAAAGELGFTRERHWLEALAREAIVARLRPVPAHQAREAAQRVAFDIPLADHPLVDTYIDYFTGRGRWFFARWLARADRYEPIMRPILAARGLPQDLVYVAMVESGFASSALSRARAAGFWQFIASTGRMYKLRADLWVDERRDFVRATEAAAAYLLVLHREFGDWHLAWAGYNAGEGRVRRAIAKHGVRDFWTLAAARGAFAKETVHYVPKIIAAAIVTKDRAKYGFNDVAALPPLRYDEISVEDATDVGAVARRFDLDVEELRDLNPALLYGVTPPGRRASLRVPVGRGAEVSAWLAGLPREQRLSYAHHRIQKGETLSHIARRHGSKVDAIRAFNHVVSARRLRPGQVLVIPVAPRRRPQPATMVAVREPAAREQRRPPTASSRSTTRHRVTAGETLWSIAQRYGVSVAQVKSWNALSSNTLRAGEVLDIHPAVPKT